jgi:hypothetical protein
MDRKIRLLVISVVIGIGTSAYPCEVISLGRVQTAADYVRSADLIFRVMTKGPVSTPEGPSFDPQGQPTARVAFDVLEVLKGTGISKELVLPAFLADRDDFNPNPVPYTIARPGSTGTGYADFYRTGGEYLLFLRELAPAQFTVRWSALAPINEQLRGEGDPWLIWVRDQLK